MNVAISLLRLHTAIDGTVWYGDDSQMATHSNLRPDDFIRELTANWALESIKTIKMVGVPSNAGLITILQQKRSANQALAKQQQVLLGSPAAVPGVGPPENPSAILRQLWQPEASQMLPGMWHSMHSNDYCVYAMLKEFSAANFNVSETMRRIARYHLIWPALTFVESLNPSAACQLLCAIVDPRWYQHPSHPSRLTRLYSYLGLTPRNAESFLGLCTPGHNYGLAALAMSAWYDVGHLTSGPDGNFLARRFWRYTERWEGLLRATQRFVDFVWFTWITAMQSSHPELIGFQPRKFFGNQAEGAAFERHIRNYKEV
jgi:hypothetical protein